MKLRNKETGKVIDSNKARIMIIAPNEIPIAFYSIKSLNENWEDYKPAEPLIKHEKIRKTLRDWAKLNNIGSVVILDAKSHIIVRSRIGISYDLEFNYKYIAEFKNIKFGESYAVEELCGEEE